MTSSPLGQNGSLSCCSLPASFPPILWIASLPLTEWASALRSRTIPTERSRPRARSDWPRVPEPSAAHAPRGRQRWCRFDVGGAAAASGKMAAWRAALVAAARLPLRGRFAGLRPPRSQRRPPSWKVVAAALVGGGSLAAYYSGRPVVFPTVLAQKEDVINVERDERLSLRKHRFMQFASLEYEGEYYMTPRDFLFSVVFDQVDRKASAKKLTKKEVDAALQSVAKAKPGPNFFRQLEDKGLISYAEYLFLLTILTKPQTGFQIAFKMLDADGNEQVEKKEFFKLQRIIGKEDDLKAAGDETVFQGAELESHAVNTILLVHFFGKEGKEKLHYSEFFRFMENLQTEVQEMEFIRFSKGLNVMRKEDFAEWLLYFTDEENNEIYWQNVKDRIEAGENISLEEFKTFCKFTNNLEDFSIAMQMFTVANLPVKRAEFKRAVKVATGQELSDNVLDTVFKIFDLDGDDCLSHGEFLGVLRNRIHRGLRVPQQQGIQGYWKCVKRESIKGAKEVWKQTGKSPF